MRLVPARIVRFFFFPPTRVDRESGLASQVPPRRQDLWKTSSEEVPTMSAKSLLCPLPASLALLLAGAHFWRAGLSALSLGCALLALLAWTRGAWVRQFLLLVLPLLAARWIWTAGQFVQLRQFMEQPWHRLAAILLGVALFTALAALPLLSGRARARYALRQDCAGTQLAALILTSGILAVVWTLVPGIFVLERFAPGWGPAQVFLPGLWAAWVAGRLADRRTAPSTRLWTWRLFSLVFFGQLLLGFVLDSRFLLSGSPHLPVPGLILAAPLYRGGGYFMLILFGVAVLLAGAAWCSQLCYFGVWDAGTAARGRPRPVPVWLPRLRLGLLGLTLLTPVALRLAGLPSVIALACGLLLGLLLLVCAVLVSRRMGFGAYCLGICPLGLVAGWLGRLSPWRVWRTDACTRCKACVRVCRYGAMTEENLSRAMPGPTCTLCRDCLSACRQKALTFSLYGTKHYGPAVESAFISQVVALHAVFLALARV